jgi:bifunctional non-homologous end joining protein LigD
MVARLVSAPFDQDGWLFELKWDGFRAIAEMDGQGAVKLYSRRHTDLTRRFRPIAQALAVLGRPATLDGEIVALDENNHPRFEWLINRGEQKGTLVYYTFDLLALDARDFTTENNDSCTWNTSRKKESPCTPEH